MTPPGRDGAPAVLAAAHIAGVDRLFRVGGAQAVAALAYGTRTIPRVDKIVGPGNIFVATAKRLVFGTVDIDMIAGPERGADHRRRACATPTSIAADLLAQAEHDRCAAAILVTPSAALAARVARALESQLAELPRSAIAAPRARALRDGVRRRRRSPRRSRSRTGSRPSTSSSRSRNPERWLPTRSRHAGAIFLGEHAPEPFGDYLAGPEPRAADRRHRALLLAARRLRLREALERHPGRPADAREARPGGRPPRPPRRPRRPRPRDRTATVGPLTTNPTRDGSRIRHWRWPAGGWWARFGATSTSLDRRPDMQWRATSAGCHRLRRGETTPPPSQPPESPVNDPRARIR